MASFFLVLSWAQMIWAAVVLWRPSRLWLWLGIGRERPRHRGLRGVAHRGPARSARTCGNPEPAGGLDVVSVVLELALIAGCVALLWRPSLADRPVRRFGAIGTAVSLAAVPAFVVAVTAAVMTPALAGPEGPTGMAAMASKPATPAAPGVPGMGDMGTTAGLPDMKMYGSTAPPTAAQVIATGQLIKQTDASLARYQNVRAAFAAGYTYVLRTNGEEHLLYDGVNPAYAGLDPQHPSSLVYAINVPHHAPILLGAMYIEGGRARAAGRRVADPLARAPGGMRRGQADHRRLRRPAARLLQPGDLASQVHGPDAARVGRPLPGRSLLRRPQQGGDQRRGPGRPRPEMTAAGAYLGGRPVGGRMGGMAGGRAGAVPTTAPARRRRRRQPRRQPARS